MTIRTFHNTLAHACPCFLVLRRNTPPTLLTVMIPIVSTSPHYTFVDLRSLDHSMTIRTFLIIHCAEALHFITP